MDLKILLWCCLITSISSTEATRRNANGSNLRKGSDPVPNFLSELGDLFLDIDKTAADQTAPKVSYEDRIATQIFRPLRHPPSAVFNRIKENYRTLQKRLGPLIEETLMPLEEWAPGDLYRTDSQSRNLLRSTLAHLKPLRNEIPKIASRVQNQLPIGAGDSLKSPANAVNLDQRTTPGKPQDPFTNLPTTGQRSERAIRNEHQSTKNEEKLKNMGVKILADVERTDSLGDVASIVAEMSTILRRRMGDIPEDSRPQERIIEEIADSETRFDKFVRQLLQTHGRWVLDNPLLNIWRDAAKISRGKVTVETNSKITSPETSELTEDGEVTLEESSTSSEPYIRSSSESQTEATEPTEVFHKLPESHPLSASYYRIDDGGEMEEVDIVLSSSLEDEGIKDKETEEVKIEVADSEVEEKSKGAVILAFTSDGIPLKLRMGPEVENPLKYLHRILRAAGVSLKIPVESYEDIEPVGKEVLLLGAGADITRTVNINVSNRNELKSLLRTLMKSKVSGSR